MLQYSAPSDVSLVCSCRERLAPREAVVVMDLLDPAVSLVTQDPLELLELL